MSGFEFRAESRPFPRWMGPFSPARGTLTGFRFHLKRLGTWVENGSAREFWRFVETPGVVALTRLVLEEWGGGRLLLLPNGLIVKPLQGDYEVGQRALVGRFSGAVVLESPDGSLFNLDEPGSLPPGSEWRGPRTTGLECAMTENGSLSCRWYHPTPTGREECGAVLARPNAALARGFASARPGTRVGRVRVTANGHVITNRQQGTGCWETRYVGRADVQSWVNKPEWIDGRYA